MLLVNIIRNSLSLNLYYPDFQLERFLGHQKLEQWKLLMNSKLPKEKFMQEELDIFLLMVNSIPVLHLELQLLKIKNFMFKQVPASLPTVNLKMNTMRLLIKQKL